MAGIADQPPAQLQVNSVPALSSRPDVDVSSIGRVPSFDTFMDAYRKGVITAEDIKRRAIVGTTPYQAERATHEANQAVAEQVNIDASQIRPKQRELQAAQIEGAMTEQSLLNRINDPDTAVSYPAREEYQNKLLDAQATALYGTPQPDLFKSTDRKPEDFDTWVARQANAFKGTDAARADFVNSLRQTGEKGEEYSGYKDAVKNERVPIPKGTPEYKRALRDVTSKHTTHEKLQELNFEVLKEAAIAGAKAKAELPAQQAAAAAKGREGALVERSRSDLLKRFAPQAEAFNKLDEIKRSGVYNNATDISLIYNYVKLLDPASAVREGEINITERSIPEVKRIWNRFQGVFTDHNKILDDTSRQNFIGEMEKLRVGAEATIKPELERIEAIAQSSGTPIEQILTKPELDILRGTTAARPTAPAAKAQATPQEVSSAPSYSSPGEVPANVRIFKTPDGRVLLNPNYKP